ncbi:hypothetical protein CN397_23980 [Priestia megaterium]|uniref:hypothetical protein n=1 Tax=Priestia megaterium TaxID=1404 RepID=UPI000BF28FA7|nr:hypothetical protein [Priestia megaterium]PEU68120.1 hypothetical protein CN397_23980 [Priestia megaterium]
MAGKIFGGIITAMTVIIGIEANVKLKTDWYRVDTLTSFWATIAIISIYILLISTQKKVYKYVDEERIKVKEEIILKLEEGLLNPTFEDIIDKVFKTKKDYYTQNMKNEVQEFVRDSLERLFDREFQLHKTAVEDRMSSFEKIFAYSLIGRQVSNGTEQQEVKIEDVLGVLSKNEKNPVSEEVS